MSPELLSGNHLPRAMKQSCAFYKKRAADRDEFKRALDEKKREVAPRLLKNDTADI